MNISKQIVIISAEKTTNTITQNRANTMELKEHLESQGFYHKRAMGMYKGTPENSFVVLVNNSNQLGRLKNLAFKVFDQESILYRDANNYATLVYSNNKIEGLGKFKAISKDKAMTLDAYTKMDDYYYATV